MNDVAEIGQVGFLFLLASWLQPLHVGPWMSWHSETLAILALLWLTGHQLAMALSMRTTQLRLPRLVFVPFVLILCVWLQFGTGLVNYLGDAVTFSGYFILAIVALGVGYNWAADSYSADAQERGEALLRVLAVTVLAGAVMSVLLALAQACEVWTSEGWIATTNGYRRPGSNMGQANHFATLALMGMASLVYLYRGSVLHRGIGTLLMLLLLLGLAVSESRTALLGMASMTLWWVLKEPVLRVRRGYSVVVFVWAIYLILRWWWPVFITDLQLVEAGDRELGRSFADAGLRQVVWKQLLSAIAVHPWFGWGLGGVSEALTAVVHEHLTSSPFTYAHNILLDMAIWMGIPMAVGLSILIGVWFFSRLRSAQDLSTWYCWAMVLPFAVHTLLEFPHAYSYFLVPVLLCIGFQEAKLNSSRTLRLNKWVGSVALGLIAVLVTWTTFEYLGIEEDYRVVRFEALRLGKTPDGYEQPKIVWLTQLDAMLAASRMQPTPAMAEEDIDALRRSAMRYPWSALQNRYALALALNGKVPEALQEMQVIRAMHGEVHYDRLKLYWKTLEDEKYPQLGLVPLP